jgi:hypothetical protein
VDEPAEHPPDPPAEHAPTATESHWYGYQTLITDGTAATMLALGALLEGDRGVPLIALGVATYAGGGPIVHLAHGRPWAALGSLGVRVGIPGVGLGIFVVSVPWGFETCRRDDCSGLGVALLGGIVGSALFFGGIIGGIVLDAGVLSREEVPARRPANVPHPTITSLAPSFDPRTSTISLAAGGTF